jgi:hypothetical protein
MRDLNLLMDNAMKDVWLIVLLVITRAVDATWDTILHKASVQSVIKIANNAQILRIIAFHVMKDLKSIWARVYLIA